MVSRIFRARVDRRSVHSMSPPGRRRRARHSVVVEVIAASVASRGTGVGVGANGRNGPAGAALDPVSVDVVEPVLIAEGGNEVVIATHESTERHQVIGY